MKAKRNKRENGHYIQAFIDTVLAYAAENGNAPACRKYDVPPATLYNWKRRLRYSNQKAA